jgi:hypothetical protein
VRGEQLGRLEAVFHLQPLQRAPQVGVHRVAGDAELAGDLLGIEVLVDESQALALPGAEEFDPSFRDVDACVHAVKVNPSVREWSRRAQRPEVEVGSRRIDTAAGPALALLTPNFAV